MNTSPCYNCENRCYLCHATCDEYKTWAKAKREVREQIKAERDKINDVTGFMVEQSGRIRRTGQEKWQKTYRERHGKG